MCTNCTVPGSLDKKKRKKVPSFIKQNVFFVFVGTVQYCATWNCSWKTRVTQLIPCSTANSRQGRAEPSHKTERWPAGEYVRNNVSTANSRQGRDEQRYKTERLPTDTVLHILILNNISHYLAILLQSYSMQIKIFMNKIHHGYI
jgi:hypothetical protein